MTTRWLAIAVLLGACASDPEPAPADPGTPDEGTVTLKTTAFTLAPGEEVTKCQWFRNPLGADLEIASFESHQSPVSHHMFLTPAPTGDAPIRDCLPGVSASETILYGSQLPEYQLTFPEGVAVLAPGEEGLRIQIHAFNSTEAPATVEVEIVLHLAEAGTVTDHAGVLIFANQDFTIPAGPTPTLITKTCTAPIDLNVVASTSHMHRRGIEFSATTTDGAELYHSTGWSEPPMKVFDPPLQLAAGQEVTWTCTFQNDTDEPIGFGLSADTDEMCNFQTRVYPVPTLSTGSFVLCP